jgi:hypothetical protein
MDQEPKFLHLPVVSLSAEYLVMGHLLRRNVLTYKAPHLLWRRPPSPGFAPRLPRDDVEAP